MYMVFNVCSKFDSFQNLEQRDIMIGKVSGMQESGLIVTLLAFDNGKARDSDNIKINVCSQSFCHLPLNDVKDITLFCTFNSNWVV